MNKYLTYPDFMPEVMRKLAKAVVNQEGHHQMRAIKAVDDSLKAHNSSFAQIYAQYTKDALLALNTSVVDGEFTPVSHENLTTIMTHSHTCSNPQLLKTSLRNLSSRFFLTKASPSLIDETLVVRKKSILPEKSDDKSTQDYVNISAIGVNEKDGIIAKFQNNTMERKPFGSYQDVHKINTLPSAQPQYAQIPLFGYRPSSEENQDSAKAAFITLADTRWHEEYKNDPLATVDRTDLEIEVELCLAPVIEEVTGTIGSPEMVITGRNFGTNNEQISVVFEGQNYPVTVPIETTLFGFNKQKLRVEIPNGAKTGDVFVQVNGVASNTAHLFIGCGLFGGACTPEQPQAFSLQFDLPDNPGPSCPIPPSFTTQSLNCPQ